MGTKTKELVKKESNDVAVKKNPYEVDSAIMGEFEGMGMGADQADASDIIMPKVQLVQAMSKAVASDGAVVGTYINSVDKSVLAEKGESVEFIALGNYKVWREFEIVQKKGETKKEYLRTISYIGNEALPIDEEIEGQTIHRDRVLAFYVLLVDEIKNGIAFPYIVDFTRSSANAGRQLQTTLAKMRSVGVPSFAKVFSLGTEFKQGEHDYYVKTVDTGRNIEKSEVAAIKEMLSFVAQNRDRLKEDDSDLKDENDETKDYSQGEAIDTTATPKF